MTGAWGVYLLQCADGTLYCGVTADLDKRLATHSSGKGAKYTRGRLPVSLVAFSGNRFERGEALRHERAIKRLPREDKRKYVDRLSEMPLRKQHAKAKSCFEEIPGIGACMAMDLHDLGFQEVQELKKADPEEMYERLRQMRGGKMDRCVLYVFRCAVYYSRTSEPDPEKLKWWNWKD